MRKKEEIEVEESDVEVMDLNDDESDAKQEEEREKKPFLKREGVQWIVSLIIAIALAYLLKRFVIINAIIPSGSMENTIMKGDRLIGFQVAYLFSEPQRGDIIVFPYPDDESTLYVKRIVGLPGEKVVIENGNIYINDSNVPLEEAYLKEEWTVADGPYEFQVPEDSYLVLGDNRNSSKDARYWNHKYVQEDKIEGKVSFIYYPFSRIGGLD